jgi:hypothetical protein
MATRDVLNFIACDLKTTTIQYRVDRQVYTGAGPNEVIVSSNYHRTVINDKSDLRNAPAQVKAIAAVFFRGN